MAASLCALAMRHLILPWYFLFLSVGWRVLLQFLGKPYQSQHLCVLVGIVLSRALPCAGWRVVLACSHFLIAWDVGQHQPVVHIHRKEHRQRAPGVSQEGSRASCRCRALGTTGETETWWDSSAESAVRGGQRLLKKEGGEEKGCPSCG